ncbi:MAG: NADH-quinone oxidoreductase subunit NuoE, partial [Mesorhizobium sp.]
MSVRRLAEASLQPASFAFNRANAAAAKQWIKKYPKGREQSAIIPLLMLAQEQEGWVTKAAIETISDMLGMPYIRGLEVATFYTQYQLNPVGTRAHIQVCGTTPCMLRGSEALMDVCRSKIHHDQFHTNDKGTLSWEEVECLGACVNAPMVMIFKDTFEDLTPERLAEIIDLYDAGKGASVTPGPQNGRITSEPITGLTTLMPGVREVLTHFHLSGIAMGVVTNKPQLAAREILLHFGLTEHLGAIVGGDAVTYLKPAPDALLLALDQLQVEPRDALMVGDSGADVAAARAAGMPVILLRGGYTQIPVEELGADLVCDNLFDLPSAMRRLQ